jgi:hypothetical protein
MPRAFQRIDARTPKARPELLQKPHHRQEFILYRDGQLVEFLREFIMQQNRPCHDLLCL